MKTVSKEEFLSRVARPAPAPVRLDGFGEDAGVYVKMMSGPERERFEVFWETPPKGISKRAIFALLVACDETGNAFFTEADLPALSDGNWGPLDAILDAGMELNAVTKAQREKLKKASGNRDTAAGSSGTASPPESSTPISLN